MQYILALDQGTTSSRAIVFGPQGRVKANAQQEFEQIFPKPGWIEHDPEEIWRSQIDVAQAALARAGLEAKDLAAIGIANQRETAVVWDRETGQPACNAIVWQDRRTAAFCDWLKREGHEPTLRKKTGLLADSYFSGPKVRWVLEHVPGAREKAEAGRLAFGTVDAWLLWNLTGAAGSDPLHATDVTNASRTLLFDIHEERWDDELLDLLDVPRAMLPEVRSSSEVYGETPADLLGAPVPVTGVAGDQQAALFGQRCTERGMAKNTYGTGCFLLTPTGPEALSSENNLLTTVAWKLGEKRTEYALEGSIFIAGAVVQWLRDELSLIDSAAEIEALARTVDSNDGVYFVPAFAGLGAPHWDPHARGTIAGLTRGTSAGHLARAALEGIAYQVADVLEAMEADASLSIEELRADGGAAANDLLLQFQSDLLGVPVVRPDVSETTALGAAYLAGLAVDFWESEEEITRQWSPNRRFSPSLDRDAAGELRSGWQRAVKRARGWAKPEDDAPSAGA